MFKRLSLATMVLTLLVASNLYAQPTIDILSNDVTYIENVGSFCASAYLANPDNDTTKVDVMFKSGTATPGADFNINTVTLVFPPNVSGFQYFCVSITDDAIVEPIENFVVVLRNPTNGATLLDSTFGVTLWDNDSTSPGVPCSDVFISEYIHSLSNGSKALEIFNPTSASINLSGYNIRVYYNGNNVAGDSIALTGNLAPNDVFVAAHPNSDSLVLLEADITDIGLNWSGDDAVILYYGNTVIDAVGIIGIDPGTGWIVGASSSTASRVIVRKPDVYHGEPNYYLGASSWIPYSQNSLTYIGNHAPLPCGFNGPTVSILTGDADIIEGPALAWTVQLINPNSDTTKVEISLASTSTVTSGSDHNFISPVTLVFPPNTGGSQYVNVPMIDDNIPEGLETMDFYISSVSNPSGYLLGDSTLSLTVWDNDSIRNDNICSDLFISDYLHDIIGDSRAIEIYNPSPVSRSLAGYSLEIFAPNDPVASTSIALTGQLDTDSTLVIAHPFSHPNVLAVADVVTSQLDFYNKSSITLVKNGLVLDAIGIPGSAPSSPGWPAGSGGTGTTGLYRIPDVQQGEPDYTYSAGNWVAYSQTDYSYLGNHTMYACGVGAPHVISIITTDAAFPEDIVALGISVGITNPDSVPITVQVSIDPSGTAGASDASINPTTLTFPANSTSSQSIGISVVDDNIREPNETFIVKISNPSGTNTLINDSLWVLTIIDNDTAASITAIQLITTEDINCIPDSLGNTYTIEGVVETPDLDAPVSTPAIFHLHDGSAGIWASGNTALPNGYVPVRGDLIQLRGTIIHNLGTTFIEADSITLLDTNMQTQTPVTVKSLDESDEGEVVLFKNARLVDPAQWTNQLPEFSVRVTDMTDTVNLHIFRASPYFGMPVPGYIFDVSGPVIQIDPNGGCERYHISPLLIDSTGVIIGSRELDFLGIEAYPNPFNGTVSFRSLGIGNWQLEIYDVNGKPVITPLRVEEALINIDLNHLPPGLYLARASQGEMVRTMKLVKE